MSFTDPAAGAKSSATIVGGSANVQTGASGGIAIQALGDAPTTITAGGSISLTAAGNTGVHLGAGAANVGFGGTGDEVWAGSGTLTVGDLGKPGAASTIHGGSGSVSVFAPNSLISFIGGSGAAALSGGEFKITAGSGGLSAVANYGLHIDSFIGGTGSATLSTDIHGSDITFGTGQSLVHELGWGSASTYHLLAGMSGSDTIENFRAGTDTLILGTGVTVASSSVVGGSAQFALNTGAHVTLAGVNTTTNIFG